MSSRYDDLIDAYQIARAMSWRYQLGLYEAESLQSILATYDAARVEILREFSRRYSTMTDWRAVRLEDVLGEVEAMTAGLRQELTGQYGSMITTAGTASIAEATAAVSLGGLISINNVALSTEQLKKFFVETPIDGRLLSHWVDSSFDATVQQQLRQAINVGVIKGEGYGPLVKRLEQGFSMARNDATTLTRTFVSAANNEARQEVYNQNKDIVKEWKCLTAEDNLVCILCLPLDGQVFKVGEGPSLPRHPCCRCTSVPVTVSWSDLGIDIDDIKKETSKWIVRGRVGNDGEIDVKPVGTGTGNPILKISRHKDADAWFQSLSDAEKRSTGLGPGRIELLNSGKITIKDLIGPDYKARTLAELREL